MRLLKRLAEPFPEGRSLPADFRFALGSGIFVTLLLYLFRPFGLATFQGNIFLLCATFGLITFATSFGHELFFRYVLRIRKDVPSWTLGKWILSVLSLILLIAFCNFGFLVYQNWTSRSLLAFGYMFVYTLGIGLFPTLISGLLIQMRALRANTLQAERLHPSQSLPQPKSVEVSLPSQTQQPPLRISLDKLLYLEAMQNYVAVVYHADNGVQKTLLRNTLSALEAVLAETSVIRCHRSFLVNTQLIEEVEGNAQGLRLQLWQLPDVSIPVSRKYIPVLREILA